MKKNNGFTILGISIIIIILSIILSVTININKSYSINNIKKVIKNIQNYNTAINNFKIKYGFLPGDIKKTQIFEFSSKNTDGNQNGVIEDKNQQKGIINKNLKMDGEIQNFWLHLYKSNFLKENTNVYPYIDFLKTGILVFSDGNKNYYHLGINGIDKNQEIETINNLSPYHAYLIDKKLDNGLPFEGKVTVVEGNKINLNNKEKTKNNKKCATEFEYLTIFKQKLCQLIIEIDL